MLILNVLQGPDKGRRFELPDYEPQLIGRSSEALPLSDMTISRRHAELTPDDGHWLINDLDSANGTFVNGTRISSPTELKPGDQIRTGTTLFVYGRMTATAPTEHPVRVLRPDRMDIDVQHTMPSSDDSVIMAVPEPSEAAQQQLTIIYELMQLVGTIFAQQILLERVLDLVFEHFQADRGFMLIRKDKNAKLEPMVVRYRSAPRSRQEGKIHVSRTIVQHVMSRGEGVLSANAMTDRRFASGDSVQAYNIHSAICVPIKFHDRIHGVIHIDSQVANYTFTEDQLRLMTAIGAQTGLALENAELYQKGLSNARLAAVGETVASLSHSIRNMLQGMRGGSEVVELGMRKQDMNVVRNGWEILARNLDRIYGLTMNMLAYSKNRKPELEMINLRQLAEDVVQLIATQADRQQVAVITEFDEGLPPIPADPNGLHQALLNLLTNALDAVEIGAGVITLRCEYDLAHHRAMIYVGDNGPGIDEQDLDSLFEPFYSTKGQRGTGLGLAVTRKIVNEHNGTIKVESKTGEGTTFIISLSTEQAADPSATNA